MPGKLSEAVTTRLRDLLQAELPAALDAIDAEMPDAIVLADVAEWILGERSAAAYPAAWVLARSAERELDESFEQLGGMLPFGRFRHGVSVAVGVFDPT